MIPALATSTCTGPHCSSIVLKAASTSSALRTSQRTARKRSGSHPSGGEGGSEDRYVVATWSPLARNHSTHAAPMPRVPPVTRTTAISGCRARGARRGADLLAPARRPPPASG